MAAPKPAALGLARAKIVVLGSAGAGKTTLVRRLIGESQSNSTWRETAGALEPAPTAGVDFAVRGCNLDGEGRQLRLHIWDTSGLPRFRELVDAYCVDLEGGDAVILVFDATSRDSFEDVPSFVRRLRDVAVGGPTGFPHVVLVATKTDAEHRAVGPDEGKALAEEVGAQAYHEVGCPLGRPTLVLGGGTLEGSIVQPLIRRCWERRPLPPPSLAMPEPSLGRCTSSTCGGQFAGPWLRCSRPLQRCYQHCFGVA